MTGDAVWYEAAFVVGMTNALNVVADGLPAGALSGADDRAGADVRALFADIRAFYGGEEPPALRVLAGDPAYAADVWAAVKRAFDDRLLSRRLKESLAFAVCVTSRSASGAAFHLGQMRRLGVTDTGVREIVGVTQMFSSYTKIADTLQLDPDMGDIAPADPTPAPGGPHAR
ncbi:MAG TPA: carboxymuconolactone decarboxylase family protein [Candidatus Limnocylindria bacterium]|nr:carboxymuconolactone decarboxylase family protein [Candidatus Limnocylindria bacterium]